MNPLGKGKSQVPTFNYMLNLRDRESEQQTDKNTDDGI